MKVAVSIPDDVLKRFDEYCKSSHMTRSGFLVWCAENYLNARESVSTMREMLSVLQPLVQQGVSGGELTEEQKKQLEAYSTVFDSFDMK